ncbi:hypothetical protein WG66_001502 [Moniliophthora roreri]|uniref:F-box domain-containing protein n=1 Tax=Moniliophthora roreri TaxID=221103 RepID=A0A0W0G5N4_MONRR|nr:hypothetical protein WG66_001502 [Moniliophthora roreri]
MSDFAVFRIQDLPVELERSIFELAARTHLSDAPQIALVSRRIRDWTQPLIYEMVTLGANDAPPFLRTMDIFPPTFFSQHVKQLCLTVSISPRDAARILQVCTGVTSLACWVDFRHSQLPVSLSELLAPFSLRRLSIEIGHFSQLSLVNCGWSTQLSHLDLRLWDSQDTLVIPGLQHLPSLTHLAIYLGHWELAIDRTSLAAILYSRPSLRVLCLVIDEDQDMDNERPAPSDPRVVYMPRPEPVPDWEAPYRGLPDTFRLAEEIVARRMGVVQT